MNEETSLISMHPFFRGFVLSIVQTIRERDFKLDERVVVDADLVPKGAESVMIASMSVDNVAPVVERPKPKPIVKRDMSRLVAPIEPEIKQVAAPEVQQKPRPVVMPPVQVRRRIAPPIRAPPVVQIQERPSKAVIAPVVMAEGVVDEDESYGKISPLLNDPSVSTIECLGANKELMIIRAGQKQKTRVVLNADEIKEVLQKVADETHIPLLEGVFRASVKGFSINAVVSEMVGSRFVIKKATAYGLLE